MKRLLVRVDNVSKKFDDNLVLKDINLDIYNKEIIGLLGLSGSGKTTLLNIICGFLKPTKGVILYNYSEFFGGEDLKPIYYKNGHFKSLIGFSTQNPSFYLQLTVEENLKYFGVLFGVDKDILNTRIKRILDVLDLTDAKKLLAKELSEGMKKRLDVGCSLIHNPKILILDEPTSNLDFKLREELLMYIQKINKSGVTIIFVSHFLEEIRTICNKVLIIDTSCKLLDSTRDILNQFEDFLKVDRQKMKRRHGEIENE